MAPSWAPHWAVKVYRNRSKASRAHLLKTPSRSECGQECVYSLDSDYDGEPFWTPEFDPATALCRTCARLDQNWTWEYRLIDSTEEFRINNRRWRVFEVWQVIYSPGGVPKFFVGPFVEAVAESSTDLQARISLLAQASTQGILWRSMCST